MIDVMRSSVNTWECDQMGHMNVRHYSARAAEGLARLAMELGFGPRKLEAAGLAVRAAGQHLRFHREMRPGAAFCLRAGVIEADEQRLRTYEEMRLVGDDVLVATIVTDAVLVQSSTFGHVPWPKEAVTRAGALAVALPAHGAPRGISGDPPRSPPPSYDEARRLVGGYLGPVTADNCDAQGFMLEAAYLARVSDGVPHFFRSLRRGHAPPGVGGAALEYRFAYHGRPRLGDVIEMRVGLKAVAKKTIQFCHWIFDVESSRCVSTSEAVAVSLDLTTRRAIDFGDEARAELEAHVIPNLAM
ncbi:MAG TPA: thioesterase family protein [Polyangiaceae bacterium]|nr:thioesterase family protein [Polyangiaceae bacterium]